MAAVNIQTMVFSLYVYALIFLLPIFNGGKGLGIRVFLEIGTFIFAALFLALGRRRTQTRPVQGVIYSAILFLVWSVLGSLVHHTFFHAFPSVMTVLAYVALFILCQNMPLWPQSKREPLLWFFCFLGAATVLYGFYQLWTGHAAVYIAGAMPFSRIASTFPNPNLYGGYLLIPFACAMALFLENLGKKKWGNSFYALIIILVCLCAGFIVSNSRGALLGLVFMGIWFVFRRGTKESPEQHKKKLRLFLYTGLAVLALLVIVPNPLMTRLVNLKAGVDTLSGLRPNIWKQTFLLACEHPLVGCGWGSYQEAMYCHAVPLETAVGRYGRFANFAHDEFLQVTGESGFPALVFFLVLLFFVYRALWQGPLSSTALAGRAVLIGLLIHSLVDFNLHPPAIVVSAIVLISAQTRKDGKSPSPAAKPWGGVFRVILILGLALGILFICLHAVGTFYASRARLDQDVHSSTLKYQAALHWFDGESQWQDELGLKYLQDSSLGDQAKAILSEECFNKAVALYPADPFPHQHLARLYDHERGMANLETLSIYEYRQAINLAPYSPFPRFELGSIFFNQKKYTEARKEWLAAVEVEPNYAAAVFGVGLTYQKQGQKILARSWFAKLDRIKKIPVTGQTTDYEKQLIFIPDKLSFQ